MSKKNSVVKSVKTHNVISPAADIPKKEIAVSQRPMWSGPLPDPKSFREYENTLPGAANRIIQIAENEQRYRHEFNMDLLRSDRLLKIIGIIAAFLIIIILLGSTIFLYYISKNQWIAMSIICEIAIIAGLFIFWSKPKKEDQSKNSNLDNK